METAPFTAFSTLSGRIRYSSLANDVKQQLFRNSRLPIAKVLAFGLSDNKMATADVGGSSLPVDFF